MINQALLNLIENEWLHVAVLVRFSADLLLIDLPCLIIRALFYRIVMAWRLKSWRMDR
jgi:hypothetical protein